MGVSLGALKSKQIDRVFKCCQSQLGCLNNEHLCGEKKSDKWCHTFGYIISRFLSVNVNHDSANNLTLVLC